MLEWFRCPAWVEDWEAWRDAANEIAALEGEVLPWPYNPEPPSAFFQLMSEADRILEDAGCNAHKGTPSVGEEA